MTAWHMGDDEGVGGFDSSLEPLYSGLASADTIRHYQKRNNIEEVTEGLSWGERLNAGYTGLAHGLSSHGPEQLYRAMRTLGKIVGSEELQSFASDGISREMRIRELDPFYHVPDNWHQDGWGRSLYEGMRGMSSSMYGMLPGAAISLIPGGQVVGLASLGVGAGSVAGLAEYDSFMDEAFDKFSALNPELTRKDIEDSHFWDAFWSGLAEGGTEAVTDIVGGKLIGLVGKSSLKPAKHVLDQLVRNVTKTITLEAGSEVATAMVQDYIREQAGLDYQGRVAAFKNALGPALVGGAAFGAAGTGLKLAQGKIHAEVNANRTADLKADMDARALELQRQFRESNYSSQAVEAFNRLTESGSDSVTASVFMEAVESTAKAWAERNGATIADWQGDSGKVTDILRRLEDRKVSPETAAAENLSSIRDFLLSELTPDQQTVIAEHYGTEVQGDSGGGQVVSLDGVRLEADIQRLLADPKDIKAIPEAVRPVVESMRNSMLDLYETASRSGLAGGFDSDLSGMAGRAIGSRNANRPKPPAFNFQPADLDNIAKQFGDFQKLTAEQQTAMIKDMAKAVQINFDKFDLPADQKAMFGFIDTEMKPILDKMMQRGKRQDAKQEAAARQYLEANGVDLQRFAEFAAQLTGDGNLKESAAVKARELMLAERIFLEKTTELAGIANESLAPADILKWHMAGVMHQQVHSMLRAVRSESGHLLRAWNFIKKDPDTSRQKLSQLYDAMGGLEGAQHRLQAYINAGSDAARAGVLSDSLRAKTTNMFIEFRTMNMLSSIPTHVVNTGGNAGTLAVEIWNRFVSQKMGGGEGVARGETLALMNGIWDGLRKVKEQWSTHREKAGGTLEALRNVNDMWGVDLSSSLIGDAGITGRSLNKQNALDVMGGIKEKMGLSREHGLISNGMATMVDYMGRVLGLSGDLLLAQDQFFKTIAAHGEVNALNHREAMRQSGGDKTKYQPIMDSLRKNTPAAHKTAAMEFAKLVTFQSDLNGFAKTMNQMRQKHPLTRVLIPFFKTPANIMKYAAAHTPGLANLIGDIHSQLNSPDTAVRHLAEARVMTGTFIWATSIGLAAGGYLTGVGPADPNEREKARAAGWQANSLRIPGRDGDTYIALNRLDPGAFLLNTAASLVEIYDSMDGDDLDKAMWAGLGAAFRVASERSYLQSIADAVDAVADWEGKAGDQARRGLFTSLVPGSAMLGTIARGTDPIQREVDGIFDAIRSGIPGMREDLPVRRNFLGEAVTSDGTFLGPDWLSPLRQSHVKEDPVYDEIYRLVQEGHKIPSMPDRHIRHGKHAVKMDGKQYSQFMELAGIGLRYGGKNAKERIAEMVASRAYQTWDDEKKASQIQSIIESYRKEARNRIKLEDPGMRYLLGIK